MPNLVLVVAFFALFFAEGSADRIMLATASGRKHLSSTEQHHQVQPTSTASDLPPVHSMDITVRQLLGGDKKKTDKEV